MTLNVESDAKRRGRPPNAAAAAVELPSTSTVADAAPVVDEPRLVEVELIRKYVPHLAYEAVDGVMTPIRDANGAFVVQNKIRLGDGTDKFGRSVPKYREILDAWPKGTILPLPVEEARNAMKSGVAKITARTF